MEKNKILEIKNLSKSFGKRKVVNDVNLYVNSGEIYGFLGPNGAGKTTTIKMILGLLSIDEGKITINDFDVVKDFEKAMKYIGAIVENPDLYGYMSGLDNLKLFARIRGVSTERIKEVVKLVDLEERINDKVDKYSLGMKQRLGLALTLLHRPKVLILDEPTNGLDPAGIRKLRDILKKLSHKENVAVFISSHLLSEMQLMCDKVAIINSGKIIKVEDLKEVLSKNKEEKVNFRIVVDNKEKANKILKNILLNSNSKSESELYISTRYVLIPEILKELLNNNINVYEVNIKENSLEEAFLNLTGGGEKDA